MPGRSRRYVAGSVPLMVANTAAPDPSRGCHGGSRRQLYSKPPSRCCSTLRPTLKSALKSLPDEEPQGNVHPIRRLYACSFASGARDTAQSITSWLARCTTNPLKPSAIAEQDGQPAV